MNIEPSFVLLFSFERDKSLRLLFFFVSIKEGKEMTAL